MSKANAKSANRPAVGLARIFRRLRRNEDGVTAVEFALIATPFFAIIVALLEVAIIHLTTLDLENAVKDASRQIRTGQAQTASLSAAGFKTEMCKHVVMIANCADNADLAIDVRSYDTFTAMNTTTSDLYDEDGNWAADLKFEPGSGEKIVVVRVSYKMKLYVQFPLVGLANIDNTHRMIDTMAVFRNEPF